MSGNMTVPREGSILPGCEGRIRDVFSLIKDRLTEAGIEDAAAESWIILEWICGVDRARYYLDYDAVIPQDKLIRLKEILDKRAGHVPLQYLMGTCEFMGYPFYVDEHVLIPRQDTECLVEECVRILSGTLQRFDNRRTDNRRSDLSEDGPAIKESDKPDLDGRRAPAVLDLCTGSGCIGISIKKLVPSARVTITDISEDALAAAGRNAHDLGADVDIICGDLFEPVHGSYHMIVSNPPYIPSEVIDDLMPEVRDHEPRLALDGARDGLAFYRRIARQAKGYLLNGAYLLFEIGMDQGADVKDILAAEGYTDIEVLKDLAGLDRIAKARLQADR